MRSLKSKDTILGVSAIFYKYDFLGLRLMGAPKDEYSGEAKQLLKRLRFELFLRSPNVRVSKDDNKTPYKRLDFTLEEILEQLCRTLDFFNSNDGSVGAIYNMKEGMIGYTKAKLEPCDRNKHVLFAKDLYDYIVDEKEVDLDPSQVDEKYCDFLRQTIKEEIETQGYDWPDFDLDGEWSLRDKNERELNDILWEIAPDPILVSFMQKNKDNENQEEDEKS